MLEPLVRKDEYFRQSLRAPKDKTLAIFYTPALLISRVHPLPSLPPSLPPSLLPSFLGDAAATCVQRQINPWFFIKRYIVLLPILAMAAYVITTNVGNTPMQLLGAGLVGFYWQQLAFLGHDAGHQTHVADRGEGLT